MQRGKVRTCDNIHHVIVTYRDISTHPSEPKSLRFAYLLLEPLVRVFFCFPKMASHPALYYFLKFFPQACLVEEAVLSH